MPHKTWKKSAALILVFLLLLLGFFGWFLYQNWERFTPVVEKVTYLQVELPKDTVLVRAGIQVQNRAPLHYHLDSVKYQISSKGIQVGWGKQLLGETLPALNHKELDFRLSLDKDRYKEVMRLHQGQDSLELEIQLQVYVDPPLLSQKTLHLNRTFSAPIPKGPAMEIDSFFVKSFSPKNGYAFQLNLNTGNPDLPDLKLSDLTYHIRIADSLTITGKFPEAIQIEKGKPIIEIPIQLETADMITLLGIQLSNKKVWNYEANVEAVLRTEHSLFENTEISVAKTGSLDTRRFNTGEVAMPSVKRLETLRLNSREKKTFLQADLLLYNPLPLPLYIDSATYVVRHKGRVVARGGNDHEKTLPAKGDQRLHLHLAVNNRLYNQIMDQPPAQGDIPLDVELVLHYNLKNHRPQRISVKEKILVPATEGPSFEVVDIGIRSISPERGARLMLKLKAENKNGGRVEIDDIRYRLKLREAIDIVGRTQDPIIIPAGNSEIEVPVNLSAKEVNLIAKGLIQGVERWEYDFSGKAVISVENTIMQETEAALKMSGVYNVGSKGSPDFMPEISKIDTVNLTIHYDTAFVNMYAAIYNSLPVTINISKLRLDVAHAGDTLAKTNEDLNIALLPDTNTFAWHYLGIQYGLYKKHVAHHQNEDSILLTMPVKLLLEFENLGSQEVLIDMSTPIPTPPVQTTFLRQFKLKGFGLRHGLKFDAVLAVKNVNSEGLTVKNIDYNLVLDNGVDLCGKINRTYTFPLGVSDVEVPINLSLWEALRMFGRQTFGNPIIHYKLNATVQASTSNPKLSNVYIIFEDHSFTDLRSKEAVAGF